MAETFSGGCQCGAVRYQSDSEMISPHYCHCRDCQWFYGAFGAGFVVLEEHTRLTGAPAEYTVQADSGHTKTHLFCGQCGTPIGERVREFAGTLVLTPGTLDDPGRFRPEMHLWVSSRPAWLVIDDGLPQYQEQPDFA